MSRTKNSIKNITISILSKSGTHISSFIYRTIFIYTLSVEYLGISGLFTNILSFLSLVELGIGSAIVYCLYQPIAIGDNEKIKSYVKLYKQIYFMIGVIILVIGSLLTPYLSFFVTELPNIEGIQRIYLLYLLNFGISYFFLYATTIINAHQKSYITALIKDGALIMVTIIQCIVLLLTKDYQLVLVLQLLSTIFMGILMTRVANHMYPYLKEKEVQPLELKEKQNIKKNVLALIHHQIASVIVFCTDNLLISKLVGIIAVGLYSNYIMITSVLSGFIAIITTSITASIGNLGVDSKVEHQLCTFYEVFLFYALLGGSMSICLYVLFQDFIVLWIGQSYLLSTVAVGIIVLNFYLTLMRKACLLVHDTNGLFWYSRYKPVVESIVNLVMSIVLAKYYGIVGILIGTTISTVTVCFWVEPYIIYKYVFKVSVITYFKKYFLHTIKMVGLLMIILFITNMFDTALFFTFIMKMITCTILIPIGVFVLFNRDEDFKRLKKRFIKNKMF